MKILIMGTGYLGTTTAVAFAELGWMVSGFDPDTDKIEALRQGRLPFYEPGLEELLRKHLQSESITFYSDPRTAVQDHDVLFLCVGTPPKADGSADLQFIQAASEQIGSCMNEPKLVVVKSTVPPGTQAKIARWIANAQRAPIRFDVVSNPEFLREGTALQDSLHPDRIIIGSDDEEAADRVRRLYERMDCPIVLTTPTTAELIKYAANSFLATKISFMNELARLCDALDVSAADVARGIGLDPRIGASFLRAGIGYGGSCFPKDVNALMFTAEQYGVPLSLLRQVEQINRSQPAYFLNRMKSRLGNMRGRRIAVLGIAFKPGTDDLREAPALAIIDALLERGASVRVHDPVARLPVGLEARGAVQRESPEGALGGADAALLCTEWPVYASADWLRIKGLMREAIVFDGRNALDARRLKALGFDYHGVGVR